MANLPSPELIATRERAAAAYQNGATTRQLAELHGVDINTVRRWLYLHKVPIRKTLPITPEEVARAEELVAGGASRSEAGRTLGRAAHSFKRHGVKCWAPEQISENMKIVQSSEYRNLGLRINAC